MGDFLVATGTPPADSGRFDDVSARVPIFLVNWTLSMTLDRNASKETVTTTFEHSDADRWYETIFTT